MFPAGSWGPAPFRIEDGKAYGPGALDMKGGVVIALYVAKALNHIGYRQTPIKVIFSGNEEKGHVGSTGDQVFLEEARGCQFAFNMETGLHTGELCVGRKGHLGCHVEVTGIESHAGNDFESGRSAIEEAAHKILAIQALTDLEEGTTVNVGVIQGAQCPMPCRAAAGSKWISGWPKKRGAAASSGCCRPSWSTAQCRAPAPPMPSMGIPPFMRPRKK